MCLISEEQLKFLAEKYICAFLKGCPDIKILAEKFWDKNKAKIKNNVYSKLKDNDIVISASFGFLLRPLFARLDKNINLLCSEVDLDEYKVDRLCFRMNKILYFNENYPSCEIQDFYTDSLNDIEFMRLAKNKAYLVNKQNISEYKFDRKE